MLHDPRLSSSARRSRTRELGPNGIAIRMLAGFAFGLILIELVAWLTGRPGVAVMFGW